jgi:cyclic nucleotide gated channel
VGGGGAEGSAQRERNAERENPSGRRSGDDEEERSARRCGAGSGRERRWRRRLGRRAASWAAADPRARWVREWNRAYLLACAAGLMVDPLFLYAVSLSGPLMCVFLDGWLAAAVTALRCMVDAMHAWNIVTQLRVSRAGRERACAAGPDEEQPEAEATAPAPAADADAAASNKLRDHGRYRKWLVLDFFVILPVMQVGKSIHLQGSLANMFL